MTAISIAPGYPNFSDTDGSSLNDGYVYIGLENQNPITAPANVFWDSAFEIPAAQPLRTSGGYIVRNGTPAAVYTGTAYSILVQNKNFVTVYNAPSAIVTNVTNNVEEITQYQGAHAFDPEYRNDGATLEVGDLYYNSVDLYLKIWTGTDWVSSTINYGGNGVTTNTAYGYDALTSNTTGAYNVGVGFDALKLSTSSQFSTAVGYSALSSNLIGSINTAVGALALQKNVAGISNTAIGHGSLAEVIGNGAISGSYNTAIGSYSQASNVSGERNVAVGLSALNVNTSGSYNVAIGNSSLGSSTGSANLEIRSGNFPAFNITNQNNYISLGSSQSTMAYIKIAWTITSDARDKMNFGDVPHGLEFVTKLKPVSYQHKLSREEEVAHGPVRYGFLAQDILELEPDGSVIIDANDPESLRLTESNLFAVLVKAIQELKSEFDAYKASHP
jgi:hypothetical protein